MLHSKVAMKGLGIWNKPLQHNIVDLFPGPGTRTDPDRWSLHGEWTYVHTHTRVLINMELQSYFLKRALINANQGPSDFLMVLNNCGFHLMQFWLEFFYSQWTWKECFFIEKAKENNINRVTWATKAILSYKTNST